MMQDDVTAEETLPNESQPQEASGSAAAKTSDAVCRICDGLVGEAAKIMENHGKSWKIMAIIIMAFFGHFMVILGLNNIFKFLIGFFRSGLV